MSVPRGSDALLLGVAVLAVSTSGPIIAACAAPALAIAFWRCLLGCAATGAWLAGRRAGAGHRAQWPADRAQWGPALLGGFLLGLHFAAWIPSLRFTSVASATALVATQPVWAALLARWRGAAVPVAVWWGIAVSLSGVLLLTGIDFSLDPRSLIGDGLALLGAVLAAAYVSAGEAARRDLSTAVYSLIGYGAAAAVLLVLTAVLGTALTGFAPRDWALIVLLTATAQLLGHSLINKVLGTVSATVTSLAILFELPGAVLIAAVWLGELPAPAILPAVLLIFGGLVIVIRSADLPEPVDPPV